MPNCKRRMDGGLNSIFGELFTKNYGENKTNFSFAFSSLTFACSSLVTYNFEQVIISRNYIILFSRIKNIFSFSSMVNAVSFTCKQILQFLRSEVTGLPYWS